MGYPKDILSTRAVVKPGLFAVIPKDGLVNNVIPGVENCKVSILASPKMGAGFVQYVVQAQPGARARALFREADVESFVYVSEGHYTVSSDGKTYDLPQGGYLYAPPGAGFSFESADGECGMLLLYKQKYVPAEGMKPWCVTGNVNDIEYRIYDDMANVYIKDLLPVDVNFDMNMHILAFEPGGCHPFCETHVQEHGAYMLSGEGMYLLDDKWMPIKKDDFIWFGAYVAQAAYGVGRELFAYIYSKDCNRDVEL